MEATKADARELAAGWHYRREWGFKSLPKSSDWEVMGKALIIVASGDGDLSAAERDWILGYMANKGAPADLLDTLAAFDGVGDLASLLPQSRAVNASRRVLIYDAIRACSSDGEFDAGERAAVAHMADAIGVTTEVVNELEALYLADQELTAHRIALVFPDGAPF